MLSLQADVIAIAIPETRQFIKKFGKLHEGPVLSCWEEMFTKGFGEGSFFERVLSFKKKVAKVG